MRGHEAVGLLTPNGAFGRCEGSPEPPPDASEGKMGGWRRGICKIQKRQRDQ